MGVAATKLSKLGGLSSMSRRFTGPSLTTKSCTAAVSVGESIGDQWKRTPKGYIPVSVGTNVSESKRFMVRVTTLRDPDFSELLCRSEEEYGFNNEGVLRIPYEAEAFEKLMVTKVQ